MLKAAKTYDSQKLKMQSKHKATKTENTAKLKAAKTENARITQNMAQCQNPAKTQNTAKTKHTANSQNAANAQNTAKTQSIQKSKHIQNILQENHSRTQIQGSPIFIQQMIITKKVSAATEMSSVSVPFAKSCANVFSQAASEIEQQNGCLVFKFGTKSPSSPRWHPMSLSL